MLASVSIAHSLYTYMFQGYVIGSYRQGEKKKNPKKQSLQKTQTCARGFLQLRKHHVQLFKKPTTNFTPCSHDYATYSNTVLCICIAAKKHPFLSKALAMPAQFLKTILESGKNNFSCLTHIQFHYYLNLHILGSCQAFIFFRQLSFRCNLGDKANTPKMWCNKHLLPNVHSFINLYLKPLFHQTTCNTITLLYREDN